MSTITDTLSVNPSSFSTDHSYYRASSQTNGYADESNKTYATINLTRGSNAVTYFYYLFDTSSIPSNAVITSVSCNCKCYISNTNSSRITTRQVQLFSGATAKGSAKTVSTSTTAFSIAAGNWTRGELNDLRLRLYAVRGTSSTTTGIYFRFYGATVTIEYEYEDASGNKIYVKVSNTWKESTKVYVKLNNSWQEVNKVYSKASNAWSEESDKSAMFNNNAIYKKGN